jgi:tungstate transport system substrate-binding protein
MNKLKKTALFFCLLLFINIAYSETDSSSERIIRIATVVICQQDDFLQYVLEPYLKEKNIKVEYRQGHHSEVAQAVKNKEADFVITHTKVKKLQKMEQKGLLNKGQQIFANPMAFLGPKDDPAKISGMTDPVEAIKKILESDHCFIINGHTRLAKIQNEFINQTGMTESCIIQSKQQNENVLDEVIEKNAYTLWGLHPYAKKGNDKLLPIVIPDKVLLSNMTGWTVKGTDAENEANKLLEYLGSDQAKKRIKEFRLKNYDNIQAWWIVD